MICGNCGTENALGTSFCTNCGIYLSPKTIVQPEPDPEPGSAPEPEPEPESAPEPEPEPRAEPEPERAPGDEPVDEPEPRPESTSTELLDTSPFINAAVARVAEGQRLAVENDRPDLADRLQATRTALTRQSFSVAVIGEFKQGKSSLVNALLQTAVCPVDADIVTAVPTLVTYAESPYATAHLDTVEGSAGEEAPPGQPIPLDRLASFIAGQAADDGGSVRLVEIGVRHRLLRSGLCLVDTPGVGGLESAQGVATMTTLSAAQGALFVTDASQELTAPEADFLQQAAKRCPSIAVVVTKIDLYPEWRRIVDIDRRHLEGLGLAVPVIPVSSFLRLRGIRDSRFSEESGFRALVQHLAASVIGGAATAAADRAATEVQFVAQELARQVEAEQVVIARPEQAEVVVAELSDAKARTARLAAPGATWQQVLADGIQDLVSDVEHDLQGRLRKVNVDVEMIIDERDPKTDWTDIEIWLKRQVALVTVAYRDMIAERTTNLVTSVADYFQADLGDIDIVATTPSGLLDHLTLPEASTLSSPSGPLGPFVVAGRIGALIPVSVGGILGVVNAGLLVAMPPLGLSLALGAGVGYKLFKGETNRQIAYRRQQGKIATRKYVENVTFVLNKECRDTLRKTQRLLRDEFQQRATSLHESSTVALSSAMAASSLDSSSRTKRAAELTARSREVQRLVAGEPTPGGATR